MLDYVNSFAERQNNIYQTIIDNSHDFIVALDNDFRFITFNRAYQQEFKRLFDADIAIGMTLVDALAHLPEEQANALMIFKNALKGENITIEMEFGNSDLVRQPYEIRLTPLRDCHNQIIGVSQIAQNISLRKQAEQTVKVLNTSLTQRVKEKTQQFNEQVLLTKTITDNTTSALFMMDAKGYPVFMNPAAERITGYLLDEIKHRPLHYAIHYKYPDGRPYPMEECPLDNSSAELKPMQNQEEVFVDKYGRLFPVIWSTAPLEKDGKTLGAVIEFRDITLEKKAEAERLAALQLAKEQEFQRAQQATEYRQKQEEFIDTVCHEIRNPLNGIYGGVGLIEDNLTILDNLFKTEANKLDSVVADKVYQTLCETRQHLKIIQQSALQQKSIVDDVLDLSKLEQKKIELNQVIFNLKEQVQLAVNMFISQIKEKKLQIDIDVEDSWIKTDAYRFTQIMMNLISNAVKFTREGSIKIQASMKAIDDKEIELTISITDTGIGLTSQEISKLFDRFAQANERTASEYGGSGLGLAITKKLIEAMRGHIKVKSIKWQGTCFEITFPVLTLTLEEQHHLGNKHIANKLPTLSQSPPALRHFMVGSKRILVVDDSEINQKILINILKKHSHLCECAKNGAEALNKYDLFNFDCIFMDIEMPIMDGMEATQKIREKEKALNRHIPIIGLSGNARKEQVDVALKAGMDAYLTKPYHPQDIYEAIKNIDKIPSNQRGIKRSYSSEENTQATRSNFFKAMPSNSSNTCSFETDTVLAPNLIESFANSFKASVSEFLAQKLSLEGSIQSNILAIKFTGTELSSYLCTFVLNDIREKIKGSLMQIGIDIISVLDNRLIITTQDNAAASNLYACFIKVGLITENLEISPKNNEFKNT